MMKTTIAILATAALVNAGTNKTLAPTPGIVRPNAPPIPPPITPFPTEPNVVRIVLCGCCCYVVLQLGWMMAAACCVEESGVARLAGW